MAKSLLLRLSGDPSRARRLAFEAAGHDSFEELVPADLVRRRAELRRLSRPAHLAVASERGKQEIGYAFAPALALATRPRSVVLLDAASGTWRAEPLARYLRAEAPFALGQLAGSALGVALQRGLAALVRSDGTTRIETRPDLRRVLYMRALVGQPASFGGSVTHTNEVISALESEGVRVDGVTSDPGIVESAGRGTQAFSWRFVDIPRLTNGIPASGALGGDLALVRSAYSSAKAADVVYQRHARFSLAGALLARLTRRPFFLEYNGSEAYFGRHWQATPLLGQLVACEEAVLAAATRIIVISEAERAMLRERGIEDARIVVNPNGVAAERFAGGGGDAVRAALGLADEDVVVGFLGSFGPWHGAPVLARAFAMIDGTHVPLRLVFIGDGQGREEVERIVEESGTRERVTFVGRVAPTDVPGYLDACDILASPHVPLPGGVEFFGSPTKLFEYMAMGKGIVASRLGQIGDVLAHEETALLVEPGDPRRLSEAIMRLGEDEGLRRRLGAAARREAVARHTWEHNARRVLDAYDAWANTRAGE